MGPAKVPNLGPRYLAFIPLNTTAFSFLHCRSQIFRSFSQIREGRSLRKITFHLGSQSGGTTIGEGGLAGESPIRQRFAGEQRCQEPLGGCCQLNPNLAPLRRGARTLIPDKSNRLCTWKFSVLGQILVKLTTLSGHQTISPILLSHRFSSGHPYESDVRSR